MLNNAVPLFPGLPGGPEVLIVLFVLVLLFGANKIPKLARSTGEAMGEFKKGRQEVEEELKNMEGGSEATSGEASSAGPEPTTDSTTTDSTTTDSTTTDSTTTDSTTTDSTTTDSTTAASDASDEGTERETN